MATLRYKPFQLLALLLWFAPSNCFWKKSGSISSIERTQNETALQCLLPPRCSLPCVGAPPPRVCPAVIPKCKHGCACYTYCENGLPVLHECFEIGDCTSKVSRSSPSTLSRYNGNQDTINTERTETGHDELRRYTRVEYNPRTRPPGEYARKNTPRRYKWGQMNFRHGRVSSLRPRVQKLHDEVRATWINTKISRPNVEFQTPKTNIRNTTCSSCCSQNSPILSKEFKLKTRFDYGHRGWIQKKSYVKKNNKYEGTALPDFRNTQVASSRRSLAQKYLKNVFADKNEVFYDKNSIRTRLPSKQTQLQNKEFSIATEKNRFIKTTLFPNDFDIKPAEHDRRVRKNELYNKSRGITQKKGIKSNRLLFTSTDFAREGLPRNFNYGRRRQSFNGQAGRRYLGGVLPQFDISQVGIIGIQTTDLNFVQSSRDYQTYRPEPTASQSQDDWFTWKNARTRLPNEVTPHTHNGKTDSDILPNKNFGQGITFDNDPSQSTILPNPGNEIRFVNNAHALNIIVPMQYYDPRTSRPKQEDGTKIRHQGLSILQHESEDKISPLNNVVGARIQLQNNRPIQNSVLISAPDGDINVQQKIQEYAPITPARKRYRTGPSNDDLRTQKNKETSKKPSQNKEFSDNTPHPAEMFHGDSVSDSVAAFLSK